MPLRSSEVSTLPRRLFPVFVRHGRSSKRFKVGYMDHEGRLVLDAVYDGGTRFYEGLASVRIGDRWGVVNTTGEFVIQPTAGWGWCRFAEGLASISVRGTWGIIDKIGKFVLEPKYGYLESFQEGLAVFRVGERAKVRYGFVDKRGVEVIPAVFHSAYGFSEGLAAVKVGNLWGFVTTSGVFGITPRFEGSRQGRLRMEDTHAGPFMNGLAPVWAGRGYRFVDTAGTFVVEGAFDEAESFHDERALVQSQGRYGFIDVTGKTAIEPRFTYARRFSEQLAAIREQEYKVGVVPPVGFIDVSGNVVVPPKFYSATNFQDGLSLVTTKDSIGYIDKLGEFVWKGPYVEYGVLC